MPQVGPRSRYSTRLVTRDQSQSVQNDRDHLVFLTWTCPSLVDTDVLPQFKHIGLNEAMHFKSFQKHFGRTKAFLSPMRI